jgi:hypothetical protein
LASGAALYDQLLSIAPSPVVALNRRRARRGRGRSPPLAAVDGLDLDGYHLFRGAPGSSAAWTADGAPPPTTALVLTSNASGALLERREAIGSVE